MEILKKVIQQTSWQVVGKATTSVSSLILLGIITRSYGEEGTGLFTLALAYLNFFYFAADLGFNAHLLPRVELDQDIIFRKLLGLRVVWAAVLVVLALVLLPFYPFSKAGFVQAVILGAPAILLSSFFITTSLLFQKHLKYNFSATALGLGAVLAIAVVYIVSKVHLPAYFLVLAHLLDWLLAAAVALVFSRRLIRYTAPIFDLTFAKSLISEIWMLSLTFTTSLVYFRVDTFILSSYRSLAEVGVYNTSYSLFQSALLGSTFIINSYYPLMLKSLDKGRGFFYKQIIKACFLMLVLAVIGVAFTQFSAGFFIRLVAGKDGFRDSVTLLKILSTSFPAFFASAILMWALISLRRYKALIVIYLIGLVFNLLANLYFIVPYSYFAAAWITVISEYLILGLQLITLSW